MQTKARGYPDAPSAPQGGLTASALTGHPNLRESVALARELNVDTYVARRTGEIVFVHGRDRVRQNLRCKSTARRVLSLLRRAANENLRT